MIPSSLIAELSAGADAALQPVLQQGAVQYGQAKPTGEVGFVAAAVLGGVPAIARAWRPILQAAGFQLRTSGVFCHQAPKATFANPSGHQISCELADLLLVVDDLTTGSVGRRWAALVQAKMAAPAGGKELTADRDLRQLDLFTRWPAFTLPSGYDPAPREFSTCRYSGAPFDSGRYGLISQQPNPDWYQQSPASSMPAGGHQLGSFLAHMLEVGQTGFGREATGNADHWSRTVEELMTVTYANLFNYVTGFGPRNPQWRGQTALAWSTVLPGQLWQLLHKVPPPSGGRPDHPEEDQPQFNGISILRIGIARNEERRG